MDIYISDKFRLRKFDEKQFVIQELRVPTGPRAKSDEPKWFDANGTGYGPFCPTVGSALVWLLNHRMINDPGEVKTIEDAISRMESIADELRHVEIGVDDGR